MSLVATKKGLGNEREKMACFYQDLVALNVKTLVLLSKIHNTPIAMAHLLQAMGCYDGEIFDI